MISVTKKTMYGFVLQCLLVNFICAEVVIGQNIRNANHVTIRLNLENATLIEFFRQVSAQTDFVFSYIEEDLDVNYRISKKSDNVLLSEVLLQISREANLKFKQVNNNINVSPLSKKAPPEKIEVIIQARTVTGKVTSDSGELLPGVNVIIKGTTQGTVTDAGGNYSLDVPSGDAVLVFSFVGFQSQEFAVGDRSVIDVVLVQDIAALQEVVVVGYGSVRKSVVTGAISSLSMDNIQPLATQRVDQMLQGRATGVLVLNTDGAPGGNTTIRIRGMNSIQGDNQPLIVIDGFQGGDLKSLNPNDIASIEVLKDAAATAIYGAQGANGVILIETKMGKSDIPTIDYSSEFGVSKIIMGGIKMMDAAEYAREMNRYAMLNNFDSEPVPIFSDEEISEFERTGGTDWMDEVYRTGLTQTHQLSLSGKSGKTSYFVSGAYLSQEGILINSGYKRYSLRANITSEINNWLRYGVNWYGTQQDQFGADFGGSITWHANPVLGAILFPPTLPVYDESGNYSRASIEYGEPGIWNPVASALEPDNERKSTQNNITLFLEFKLLKGLSLRSTGGARISSWLGTQFYNDNTSIGQPAGGIGRASTSNTRDLQNSNVLTYVRDFGGHHINAIAVQEIKYSQSYSTSIDNSNFTVQETGMYNLGGASKQITGSSFSERKINSYLGRINYGYNDKYVFSASYRADGSSVFGANNKWAYFPSISAGWRLTEERFVKDLAVFDNLMIRGSWGRTGNQAISPYRTLARITGAGFYPWDGGESSNLAFQLASASNPNLKWESTTQTNIGLDMAFLEGRLRFTSDYYDKVTDDLLLARELPRSTGLSSIIDNVGSIGNKGWEFSLEGDISISTLKWTTGINLTSSRTTVLDLGEDEFIAYSASGAGHGTELPNMFLTEGEPFGQIMGFGYEGTWQIGEEEQAGRYGQMPGDPKFTDVNDDGRIDYDNDFKVIGNAQPDFVFGFNNHFNYKNLELSFLIQGSHGNDIYNVARVRREYPSGYGIEKLNRWTPANQNTGIPALIDQKTRDEYRLAWNAAHPDSPLISTIALPARGVNMTERYLEDGSYVRLRIITLAYNLPSAKFVRNLRVYFTGTNLLTLTGYSGWDPEVSSYTSNDAQLGTDYNNYPNSRIYTFGINATF